MNSGGGFPLLPGDLGLPEDQPWDMHDLLDSRRASWKGSTHYMRLNPQKTPVRIFRAG